MERLQSAEGQGVMKQFPPPLTDRAVSPGLQVERLQGAEGQRVMKQSPLTN